MNIIIVGDGKVGNTLTRLLTMEGHDLVVIDSKAEALTDSRNRLDVITLNGNGASIDVLREAGAEDADLLIAATSLDEVNILSCMLAKKLGTEHTIARVRTQDYLKSLSFLKEEMGLSMTINPEMESAIEILKVLRFPSAVNVDTFAGGRVEVVEIKLMEGNPLIGRRLADLRSEIADSFIVCAVDRNSEVIIPNGDFVFAEDDKLSITGNRSKITRVFKKLKIFKKMVRDVVIIGGGTIAYYLTVSLLKHGIKVKIVEKDRARATLLCELLPGAKILCGDGTVADLWREEQIYQTDAVVALTGMDEQNIIIALMAKDSECKVVSKISHQSFTSILDDLDIDTVISPKYITASQIVSYVRAMQNSMGSKVTALYRILDGNVEALEFIVENGGAFTGKKLSDLVIKPGVLIACIQRKGKIIFPTGDSTIEELDRVIVTTTLPKLSDLSEIFVHSSDTEI